jgi:hypothetical protein
MPAKGYTASELAELTKKTRHAVESWLSTHGIKPLSYEAIYPAETLEQLLASKRGRPAKPKNAEPSTKTRKAPGKGEKP